MHYARLSFVAALLMGCPATEEQAGGTATEGSSGIGDGGTADSDPSAVSTPGDGSGDGSADGTAGDETPPTSDGPGSDSASDGSTDPTSGGSSSDGSSDGGTTGQVACVEIECGNQLYECGDCIDNDRDGEADQFDVECVSPCDDDESSFATGLPGDNSDLCKQDCFFDGNSGSGNDGCEWSLACDPLDPDEGECDIPAQGCPETFPQECLDNCEVPNGCDCFGCCTVVIGDQELSIVIGAPGCALENLDACPICTPVAECSDPCEPEDCELCFGETELPEGCENPECRGGVASCRVNEECGENEYCQTGCCTPTPQ